MHLNIYSLGGQWRGSKILYRNDFYKMKAISINEKNHCIKVQPESLLIFLIIVHSLESFCLMKLTFYPTEAAHYCIIINVYKKCIVAYDKLP